MTRKINLEFCPESTPAQRAAGLLDRLNGFGPGTVDAQLERPMRTITSKGLRRGATGLWGEVLAAEALEGVGWDVTLEGGNRGGSDLIAEKEDVRLLAQVKSSAKEEGWIHWSRPGMAGVQPLIKKAARKNAHPVFVLLWLELSEAYQDEGFLIVTRPKVLSLTAATAAEWGQFVDYQRGVYAQEPYKSGPNIGQPRPESGLALPCKVDHFLELGELFDQDRVGLGGVRWSGQTNHSTRTA